MKKKINIIEKIKEIKKQKNGKAILFFGFYFVFFLILILFVRFAPRHPIGKSNYENGTPIYFSYGVLNSKNYNFNISVNIDDNNNSYVGEKNGDIESFEFNSKKYYRNNDDYYELNDKWGKVDNPYVGYSFIDGQNIIKLVNSSYYESGTTYGDGRGLYKMLLSTNTIYKVLENKDTDIDETPNKIEISTDANKNIEKIVIYLDSYCVNKGICNKSMKIELIYSNYGNIPEITNPINS